MKKYLRGRSKFGLLSLAPEALDVALDATCHGVFLPEFLLVADTLDGLGVEGEGSLGSEGSDEYDNGANAELETVENHEHITLVQNRQNQGNSPPDARQTTSDVPVSRKVLVYDRSEDRTQDSIHSDVRRV